MQRFSRYLKKKNQQWSDLTRNDVESYLLTVNGRQAVRKNTWRVLRDFYAFHKWNGPPTHGITFRKEPKKLPKVPSEATIAEKISDVSGPEPQIALRNRLMAELAYGSALRRRELSLLDIEDLDVSKRIAYVQGKGGKPRIVPITGRSVQAAQGIPQGAKAKPRTSFCCLQQGEQAKAYAEYHWRRVQETDGA